MTDGRTDRRTDGQTDGRTDGQTDGGDCNIPYAFLKKRVDNNVCLNTFWLCKPSKLIWQGRYVNTNIKTKGLSSMLNIF